VPGPSTKPISAPGGLPSDAETAGGTGFDAFREIVLADPALQARLRATVDWDGLAAAVEQLARERGIDITSEDLVDARRRARRVRVARDV
jgi:hypothetical protein